MCGILGFYAGSDSFYSRAANWLLEAKDTLIHRGPDSQGHTLNSIARFGLAHLRLAIVDLTDAGHQPMVSGDSHWQIVFNGEIYNHLTLRKQIEQEFGAVQWKGHSDTETLLAGFSCWGFEATLQKSVGMFAIAAMHTSERRLYLARDRFGEKPLYYHVDSTQGFAFGSELKALTASNFVASDINTQALGQYLQHQYVGGSSSIFNNLYKLQPGHILTVDLTRAGIRVGPQTPYWCYAEVVEQGLAKPIHDENLALSKLEEVLSQAIEEQMVADVPLGAFLSGGVDSSLITALMQNLAKGSVDTFTVGFDQADYDESAHAKAVAKHLGTNHHELRVTAKDALEVIPNLPTMYCEPFADSSQIPTHLVCRAAKQVATVALSGDAGDEIFGGYNRYLWGERVWRKIGPLGRVGRNSAAFALESMSPKTWSAIASIVRPEGGASGVGRVGEKLHKLASKMQHCGSLDEFYFHLISEWIRPELIMKPTFNRSNSLPAAPVSIEQDAIAKMMYRDAIGYLPGDILTKVDRAAMAISLETRAPFLDHRVASLAWQLPSHMKIRNGVGKWALRELLYRHVPKELIERPKTGFSIPLAFWLRHELRDWAEALLKPIFQNASPWFEAKPIQKTWLAHQSGKYDYSARLWSILMFQAWLETQQRGIN